MQIAPRRETPLILDWRGGGGLTFASKCATELNPWIKILEKKFVYICIAINLNFVYNKSVIVDV